MSLWLGAGLLTWSQGPLCNNSFSCNVVVTTVATVLLGEFSLPGQVCLLSPEGPCPPLQTSFTSRETVTLVICDFSFPVAPELKDPNLQLCLLVGTTSQMSTLGTQRGDGNVRT